MYGLGYIMKMIPQAYIWQPMEYENISPYCDYCIHKGHYIEECKSKIRDEEYRQRKEKENQKKNRSKENQRNNNLESKQGITKEVKEQLQQHYEESDKKNNQFTKRRMNDTLKE